MSKNTFNNTGEEHKIHFMGFCGFLTAPNTKIQEQFSNITVVIYIPERQCNVIRILHSVIHKYVLKHKSFVYMLITWIIIYINAI